MLVEASGGAARISAARAPGVPDAEVDSAAEHARSCAARLAGLDTLRPGTMQIDAEPLPAARKAAGRDPFAAVPVLLDRREVCGALYVRGSLGESDLAFLSAAADELSLALDRHAAWEREVRLRERAEALDRAQKELVAVVSHDLRNPLGAVLLGLSTLRRWPQLDAQTVREHLDTIHRAAERASRLVHDLLDAARIDAGGLQLDLVAADVSALVREAAELMRPLLANGQLRCDTQVEEGLPPALVDRERILQVFSNLMGNALKFAQPGTTVSLIAWAEDGEIRCGVADEGPGISPADLPRVFDRYFQGEHGPTAHGAGLGLSIARGIVEAHGGRIWVETAQGRGSRFFFSLPAA
jgi:signal transduction histidine kinase